MRRLLSVILLATAAPVTAPALAAEVQIAVQGPVVELQVTSTAPAKPDMARISAGVTTRAQTAVEASRQNAEQMRKVIDKLISLGISREDIQTTGFSVNPQWQYRQDNQPPLFLGYQVTNRVSFKLRKLDQAGPFLDALIVAGANDINGPDFSVEDDTAPRAAARKAAFASAQARGKELAALAGYTGLRLLEVSETYETRARQAETRDIVVTASKVGGAPPIEAGQVETAATLTVKYEMVR